MYYTDSTSENQLSFSAFDSIPAVENAPRTKKPKTEYYLRAVNKGEWYFLWCTHTNGGCEWEPETELTTNGGKKKPLRYKTLSGAQRMLSVYLGYLSHDVPREVAVWHE